MDARPHRRARLAHTFILLAALVLGATGLYGIASPFIFGHYGYHGGEYSTRARHTLRHGTILPGNAVGWRKPAPETYYVHHPVLTHHLVTLTMFVLGDHEYAVRAGGLLAFCVSLLGLVLVVRRNFGPWQAALAAWVYVLLPINVWFANHMDPGAPSIACVLLFFYFYLAWVEDGRWRSAGPALLFIALAGGFEWSPYLAAVPIFVHVLLTGWRRRGRYLIFVPLYVLAVVLPAVVHLLIVSRTGHLGELLSSYHVRSAATDYAGFLRRMDEYGRAMYGPVLFYAIGPWLLLQAVRLVLLRWRARDLVGLTFLFALLTYIHIFKVAVLIHIYRFLYGNVLCAIVAVDLAEAAGGLLWRALGKSRRRDRYRMGMSAAVGAALLLALLKPAWSALLESRAHGGVPLWGKYDPELDKLAIGESARLATQPGDVVYVHRSLHHRREVGYYVDREEVGDAPFSQVLALSPAEQQHAVVLCTPEALLPDERKTVERLAQDHPLLLVDRYLLIDLRHHGRVLRVQTLHPPARGWLSRYLVGPYAFPERREGPPIHGDPGPFLWPPRGRP